jgi:hypothetical protein
MATLNASKWGYIIGSSSTNFITAATTGFSAVNNPSADYGYAISYTAQSGRGSLTHNLIRSYAYFDTSSITDTVTACTLNIEGYSLNSSDIYVIKSTAFGGDGSSSLTTGEFYTSLDYDTEYSLEITSWSTSSNNSIALKDDALTAMTSNNHLILALVNADYDAAKTGSAVAITERSGIAFSTTIYLDYQTAPAGDIDSVIGVSTANISKIYGTDYVDISKIYEKST